MRLSGRLSIVEDISDQQTPEASERGAYAPGITLSLFYTTLRAGFLTDRYGTGDRAWHERRMPA